MTKSSALLKHVEPSSFREKHLKTRLFAASFPFFMGLGCNLETTSTNPSVKESAAAASSAPPSTGAQASSEPKPVVEKAREPDPLPPASAARLTPGARPISGLSGWYEDRERGMLFITNPAVASQVIRAGWMHDDLSNGKRFDGLPKQNGTQVSPGVWSVGRPLASFGKPDGWLVNMSPSYGGPVTERNAAGGWHNIAINNGALIPAKHGKG